MNTIKEFYGQLAKEDLGTEKSRILLNGEEYKLIGPDGDGGFVIFGFKLEFCEASARVEWIRNKPKTNKFEKYLVMYSENHCSVEFFANDDEAAEYCKYHGSPFIKKWETHSDGTITLPEDIHSSPQ